MALFSNLVSFLFFTILLLLSPQIHARDSQFFSKVTHSINNKKESEPETMDKPDQQDQPNFMSETDNNYGLYGHDESTATYQPYKTESEEYMRKYPNNKYSYYNRNNFYNDAYGNDLDSTRYIEGGYEDVSSNHMRKKNQKLYNSNSGGYGRYDEYNGGRQGMSDTGFMGGYGKYYYENNNFIEGDQNHVLSGPHDGMFEGDYRDDFQP